MCSERGTACRSAAKGTIKLCSFNQAYGSSQTWISDQLKPVTKLTPACNGLVPELLRWNEVYIVNRMIPTPGDWKCHAVESDSIVLQVAKI